MKFFKSNLFYILYATIAVLSLLIYAFYKGVIFGKHIS